MEQQLSEATSNAGSWTMEDEEKLCTLENTVREKERVISRLECQVEEQVICLSLLLSLSFHSYQLNSFWSIFIKIHFSPTLFLSHFRLFRSAAFPSPWSNNGSGNGSGATTLCIAT